MAASLHACRTPLQGPISGESGKGSSIWCGRANIWVRGDGSSTRAGELMCRLSCATRTLVCRTYKVLHYLALQRRHQFRGQAAISSPGTQRAAPTVTFGLGFSRRGRLQAKEWVVEVGENVAGVLPLQLLASAVVVLAAVLVLLFWSRLLCWCCCFGPGCCASAVCCAGA